jgi:hypothetical protein
VFRSSCGAGLVLGAMLFNCSKATPEVITDNSQLPARIAFI